MVCWRDLPLISHGGCLPPARPPPGVFHGFIVGASAMWITVSSVRYRTVLPLRYARCRILTKRDKKSCGIMGALRKIAQRETAVLWERYERYSGSATITTQSSLWFGVLPIEKLLIFISNNYFFVQNSIDVKPYVITRFVSFIFFITIEQYEVLNQFTFCLLVKFFFYLIRIIV